MATSLSAKKRIRQNETSRLANKSKKSAMKSAMKRVLGAIEENDAKAAQAALPQAMKMIDKAAHGGAIHANTASRRKSRLSRAIASLAVK
ncbi:MAG: 30S ribosomal protein S20 [Planctomycetes bacterium]|nr:30S ribosomal protein S20 [Planctomycetota bacterium]